MPGSGLNEQVLCLTGRNAPANVAGGWQTVRVAGVRSGSLTPRKVSNEEDVI